jgi:hypothetical protein
MDHISKHLNNQGRSTTTTQAGETSSSVNKDTLELVNQIFERLRAIYPAWKQAMPDNDAVRASKKEWLGGLMDAGIADWGLIQAGVDACRGSGSPFWPSVGQFIGYCHKAAMERMGALETMAAYHHLLAYYTRPVDLREPCDLDPLVYHTISQAGFDTYRFRTEMTAENSVKYFSEQYRGTITHASTGGTLKAPIKKEHRIENPSGVTHGNCEDIARKTLDDLKRMLKE